VGETEVSRGEFRQVEGLGENSHDALVKNSLVKMKCQIVHCHDTTTSSFVTKGWCKVLACSHVVTIKCHSSMQN
jgi:hypothetical protein